MLVGDIWSNNAVRQHDTTVWAWPLRKLCDTMRTEPNTCNAAIKTLVHAFISSRLDYYNQLFVGVTGWLLDKLQSLQNAAARLVTGARKFDHITPVMRELHWLPVRQSIWFKTAVLVFKCLHGLAPAYLSTASWRPAVHICDQPTRACCLFRARISLQPTATGVLLSVDQSRGTVYLWHCDRDITEETFRRQLKMKTFLFNCLDN